MLNVEAQMVGFSCFQAVLISLSANQIAHFSSFGVVILSEVLSPSFNLNSPIVRHVLRDWIAHGDVAAVWTTRPLALSTVSCRLEACHQANVVGFFAELRNDTTCQSLAHCVNNKFVFQQVPMDMCACGLTFKRRFMLVSVHVPLHMKLARRCDNQGNVCSFSCKAQRRLGSCLNGYFFHQAQRVRFAVVVARALGSLVHMPRTSWTNKRCWLN